MPGMPGIPGIPGIIGAIIPGMAGIADGRPGIAEPIGGRGIIPGKAPGMGGLGIADGKLGIAEFIGGRGIGAEGAEGLGIAGLGLGIAGCGLGGCGLGAAWLELVCGAGLSIPGKSGRGAGAAGPAEGAVCPALDALDALEAADGAAGWASSALRCWRLSCWSMAASSTARTASGTATGCVRFRANSASRCARMRWMVSLICWPSTRFVVASRARRTSCCFFQAGSICSIRTCSFTCSVGTYRCVRASNITFGPALDEPFSEGSKCSTTFRPDDETPDGETPDETPDETGWDGVREAGAGVSSSAGSISTSICSG